MKTSSFIFLTCVTGLFALLVILAGAFPVAAQQATPGQKMDEAHGGIGLSYYMPQGNLKETHDSGYGISFMFNYPISDMMDLTGTTAWSRYIINEQPANTLRGSSDLTVWEFTLGPRVRVSIVYLGIEAGYFTNFNEWALVPNAGIRWRIFDLGYRMKTNAGTEVHSIRAGIFF